MFKGVPQAAPGCQILLNLAGEGSTGGAVHHDWLAEPSELSQGRLRPGCRWLRLPGQPLEFGDNGGQEDASLGGEGIHYRLLQRLVHGQRDQGARVWEPDLRLGCRRGSRFGMDGHKSMLSEPSLGRAEGSAPMTYSHS